MMVRRVALWIVALLLFPLVSAAEEAPASVLLHVAAVFDLEGRFADFGQTARRGLNAGQSRADEALRPTGLHLKIQTINTRGDLSPEGSAAREVSRFLADGGRVLFGAETTGATNQLLDLLVDWAKRNLGPGDQPILLFAPVSTSVLERQGRRWSNQLSKRVSLYRVAVSDEQALRELFTGGVRLRYDLLGDSRMTVSPGAREVWQHLALFAEGDGESQNFSAVGSGEFTGDAIQGKPISLDRYTQGFLENLHRAIEAGFRNFAERIVIWDPESERPDDLDRVRAAVEEVVRNESIRAVGIIGYVDFVRRTNGLFEQVIEESGLSERALPDSLWRFTGGTVKLEHVLSAPVEEVGSLSGIHFLRTVPSEGELDAEERSILQSIVKSKGGSEGNLAKQVDDHALHAYLGLQILAQTVAEVVAQNPGSLDYGEIRNWLNDYDVEATKKANQLRLPFFGKVQFSAEGDIQASRHVFYVRGTSEKGYEIYQTDIQSGSPMSLALLSVLGLGFLAAVVVLVNWQRILGSRRKPGAIGIANPYVYGVPVTKPEMYFGRRDAFRKIIDALKEAPFGLLITGGRRSGKSSFLQLITRGALPPPLEHSKGGIKIPEWVVPIYLDLQKLPNYPSEDELLRHFLRGSIEKAVRGKGLEPEEVSVEDDNEYRRIIRLLEEVRRQRPQWMILLLFDEIELLNDRMRAGTLGEEFPRVVRGWVQGTTTRVSVVFTGSPLETFEEDRKFWTPLEGMMTKLNLGPLSRHETMALASEPVAEEVIVEESIQEDFYHLSGGQPFLCQAICHMAVNVLNVEKVERLPAKMSRETVEAAVDDFVENTPGHVDDMWSRFPPEEQYLLLLMAKRLKLRHEAVTLDGLLEFAASQGFEITDGDRVRLVPIWKRALERLVTEKQFVAIDRDDGVPEPGREAFYFVIDLLRRWLRRKPIWPVIDAVKGRYSGPAEREVTAAPSDR